jgi:hypothetical protein
MAQGDRRNFGVGVAGLGPSTARRPPGPRRLARIASASWQDGRGSNPHRPVLETGALPVELLPLQDGSEVRVPHSHPHGHAVGFTSTGSAVVR